MYRYSTLSQLTNLSGRTEMRFNQTFLKEFGVEVTPCKLTVYI